MDGLNEWTDVATNRRNGRKNRLDRQTDGWTDRCKDGQEWIDQQTDLPTGRTDGWTGWTDGQTDRWMHGMERHGRDKRTDDGLIDKLLDRSE